MLNVKKENAKKMQPIIWAYSSYFYYAIISFFEGMPKHKESFLKTLKSKGVEPVQIIE